MTLMMITSSCFSFVRESVMSERAAMKNTLQHESTLHVRPYGNSSVSHEMLTCTSLIENKFLMMILLHPPALHSVLVPYR